MPARKRPAANNHLQDAMALLIRNQAAFVEQIARNDQERLTLQRKSDAWRREVDEWRRRADERFDRIEQRLSRMETILVQLPKALKKEIGLKLRT